MWTDPATLALHGQRVFLRADLNVPLNDGVITDDTRITSSLRTLQALREQGCQVVLASHLGRPKGVDPTLSLAPVAAHLATLLGCEVPLITDYVETDPFAAGFPASGIVLLENLRFHPGEEKNDAAFAAVLARFATAYVNDAFGTAHRAAASIVGIAHLLPSYPGFLLYEEVEQLSRLLNLGVEDRPFVALVGGSKVSDKLPILRNLLIRADQLLIGGAMAFTFIKAEGGAVGRSLVETDALEDAMAFLNESEMRGKLIFLPDDAVCGTSLKEPAVGVHPADQIPDSLAGFDIGPETIEKFSDILSEATTIFWNGPVGVFENPQYAEGTLELARRIADGDATAVAGGGDSLAAIHQAGVADGFTHLSTGGGASLELLAGLELPGIAALKAGG